VRVRVVFWCAYLWQLPAAAEATVQSSWTDVSL